MARKIYIGDGTSTKKISKIYIGDGSTTRKVKKIYIGDDNGKARLCFSSELQFTYNGKFSKHINEATGNWEIALLTSGTLTFQSLPDDYIDVFLVGGGHSGGTGDGDGNGYEWGSWGGPGGSGGFSYIKSGVFAKINQQYSIVIAGQGGNSSGFGYASNSSNTNDGSGIRKNGGSGGRNATWGAWVPTRTSTPGEDGNLAFNTSSTAYSPGYRYGAGGGGGGAVGFAGNVNNEHKMAPGAGGKHGGGSGGAGWTYESGGIGYNVVNDGVGGTPNSGSGGGGGGSRGGAGGSGIIIIRNHR